MPESAVAVHSVKKRRRTCGPYGSWIFSRISHLVKRGFTTISTDTNFQRYEYQAMYLTEDAWAWIEANEDISKIHKRKVAQSALFGTNYGRRAVLAQPAFHNG